MLFFQIFFKLIISYYNILSFIILILIYVAKLLIVAGLERNSCLKCELFQTQLLLNEEAWYMDDAESLSAILFSGITYILAQFLNHVVVKSDCKREREWFNRYKILILLRQMDNGVYIKYFSFFITKKLITVYNRNIIKIKY